MRHFSEQFGSAESVLLEDFRPLIPSVLSSQDNEALVVTPAGQEIKEAVFDLDPWSVAGPDDFNGRFYQKFWEIIEEDFCEAVTSFFRGDDLPVGAKATVMSLIPKVDNPKSWTEFRPISLCTCFNKVISKIINK